MWSEDGRFGEEGGSGEAGLGGDSAAATGGSRRRMVRDSGRGVDWRMCEEDDWRAEQEQVS